MSAVKDTVSDIGDAVGGVVESVGDVASDVVDTAANVVEDTGKAIGDAVDSTIKAVEEDPLSAAVKIAAVATGNAWALPLISGAETLAKGGSLEDAATNAAITYAAGEAGSYAGGETYAATGSQGAATAAGGAAGGATGAALHGGDVTTGAIAGGINAYGNAQLKGATTNIGATPEIAPAGTVNSGGTAIASDAGMSPSETAATDWASIYNEPSVDPVTGETTTPVDASAYPNQDLVIDGKSSSALYAPGSTGFSSDWQTVGSDRIQIQDDGTAIGINTETGEQYTLGQDEVMVMEQNGLINTDASGYTGAISGTSKGFSVPLPNVNFAGALLGGSKQGTPTGGTDIGASVGAGTGAGASSPYLDSTASSTAAKKSSDYSQEQLNPLLFKLAFDTPKQSASSYNPFSDVALGTSAFSGPSGGSSNGIDPFESIALDTSFGQPSNATQTQQAQAPKVEESSYFAQGGLARVHPMGEPQFYSEGGLGNRYTKGEGDGTSDEIPAMLANNEFVIPADVVSALGNGSSDAGASKLDQMIHQIRKRARSTEASDLPPPAYESPLDYLKGKA